MCVTGRQPMADAWLDTDKPAVQFEQAGTDRCDKCHCPQVPMVAVPATGRRKCDQYYCEKDLTATIESIVSLTEGCFYFAEVSVDESRVMLRRSEVGTFFVRDSSHHKYLYTISVKTRRGPTSIRIIYESGRFALDANEKSRPYIRKFTSLLELLDHYIRLSRSRTREQCRFLEKSGVKDLPIIMDKPMFESVPSLKHLCRTQINRSLPAKSSQEIPECADQLDTLPKRLRSYIKDYPYLY